MKTNRLGIAAAFVYLAGLAGILSLLYHRPAIPWAVVYIPLGGILMAVLTGLGRWKYWTAAVLLALIYFAFHCGGEIDCSYCHNSNDNVKGHCVKRQREGWCDEDYYDKHNNKDSCGWCGRTGRQSRIASFMD